jgi:hypothetical protein
MPLRGACCLPDSADVNLCENVLRALAQRPGRIYEGHHEDITPFTPFAKAVGDAAAGVVNAATKGG